eukprot:1082-Chlamydomonas_euryale.AAC.2
MQATLRLAIKAQKGPKCHYRSLGTIFSAGSLHEHSPKVSKTRAAPRILGCNLSRPVSADHWVSAVGDSPVAARTVRNLGCAKYIPLVAGAGASSELWRDMHPSTCAYYSVEHRRRAAANGSPWLRTQEEGACMCGEGEGLQEFKWLPSC